MKQFSTVTAGYALMLLLAIFPMQQTTAPERAVAQDPREVRALWVVRHTMTSPGAVKILVERASANGITDLIVQVRGRGDAYYNSPYEPRAAELQGLPADFDPLSLVIDEAHRAGLRVHAWLNTYLVSDAGNLPTSTAHLIYQHPEWLMVPRGLAAELYYRDPRQPEYLARLADYARQNPRSLEGLFISPANPVVRQQLLRLWLDIATRYEVDGLHFDYVRYPSPEYDYSRVSLDQFRREMVRTLPEDDRDFLVRRMDQDPLLQVRTFPDQYAQFQRRQVNLLVERIYREVKKVRPDLKISAAVFANETDAVRSRFQDWKTWLQRGWLDAVCPMAYTPDTRLFERQITTAIALAGGREVWSGIGAYRQAVDEAREKIELSRQLGTKGFILFSYNSLIEASPNNPRGQYLENLRDLIVAPVDED